MKMLQSIDGFMVSRRTVDLGEADHLCKGSIAGETGSDQFVLCLPLKGEHEVSQFSRSQSFGPGSLVLISLADPFVHRVMGDNDTIYFFMPNEFVEQRLLGSEKVCGQPIVTGGGLSRLVHDSLWSLQATANDMSKAEVRYAMKNIGELSLLALYGAVATPRASRSVRVCNLARAKRIIRDNLADPDLTVGQIAKKCGISLRYLHELFKFNGEGETAYTYLKARRLQQARHMLETSGSSTTVTEVALDCGFSNTSQFSTAFRQAFSMSPRDILRGRLLSA